MFTFIVAVLSFSFSVHLHCTSFAVWVFTWEGHHPHHQGAPGETFRKQMGCKCIAPLPGKQGEEEGGSGGQGVKLVT